MKTDDFLADFERVLRDAAVRRLEDRAATPTERRRRRKLPRQGVLGLALAGVVALATAVVVVRAPSPPGQPAEERPVATLTPAPPRYSVLEGPPTAQLTQTQYESLVEDPVVRRMGLKWDQLHTATSGHDVTVYAAPTDTEDICVVAASRRYGTSQRCAEPAADRRALTIRFGVDGGTLVAGLVPDGATGVLIETGSTTVPAQVHDNGFVARIGDDTAELRWSDASGTHVEPLPPSAASVPAPDGYDGRAETQSLAARSPLPGSDEVAGMLTYRSQDGRVCTITGLVRDGRLGRYDPNGRFATIDVGPGPGSCGDIAQNLEDLGGIAMGSQIPLGAWSSKVTRAVLHGLVRSQSTTVTVTWRDGTQQQAAVAPTAAPEQLDGAEGAFVIAGPPDVDLRGARVQLTASDGTTLHEFEF